MTILDVLGIGHFGRFFVFWGVFCILGILFIFRVYVYVSIFCLTSRKANTCVTSVLDQYCARGRGQNFPRIRLVGGPFMNIMDIHICYTFLCPICVSFATSDWRRCALEMHPTKGLIKKTKMFIPAERC